MKQTLCSLLFFFSSGQIFPQANTSESKIKTALEDYFYLTRENIHVQFNKKLYVSNEKIAFKGYIFNKQNTIPNIETTNVQLVIYNTKGKVVQKQLLAASLASFEGIAEMNDTISSGNYRFHFYTNWMNNFKEDESFEQTIEIVNKKEAYNLNSTQADYKTVSVTLYPESGTLLKDIKNSVGIQVKDCNQLGIQVPRGILIDSKGTTIVTFFTNKMGYGRFDFIPIAGEKYSVQIANEKLDLKQALPAVQNSGLVISPNNNLPDNILAVAVHTNESGLELYKNKNFNLVVHQNAILVQQSFNFNDKNPSQVINLDKSLLSTGVNTIRIIDENNNEIAQRLIYIHGITKVTPILDAQLGAGDKITLFGKIASQNANLSVSILPSEAVCLEQNNSIPGTFYLNAYLEKPEQNNYSYFDKSNKFRAYDIELLLLSKEKSKYQWNNISTNPPKNLYAFTKGVSLNGTIVKDLDPKKKYKVSLVSFKNSAFEEAVVENNKFKFDNFFVQDSTAYALELMDESNKPIETKMILNILNAEQPFNKKPIFEIAYCAPKKESGLTFTFTNPNEASALKEVEIKNKYKKPVFIHQKEANNIMARAYKIDDNEFGTILAFLGRNGYNTGVNNEFNAYVTDTRYAYTSRENGVPSPTVYIDDIQIFDLNILFQWDVRDVDEIYTDKTGSSNVVSGGLGTIRIYLKKGTDTKSIRQKHTTLVAKSGFTKKKTYTATDFANAKELNAFGTLEWAPNVFLDANQSFYINFPNKMQKEITVIIEGFTVEGQFISEIKKIPLAQKL